MSIFNKETIKHWQLLDNSNGNIDSVATAVAMVGFVRLQ